MNQAVLIGYDALANSNLTGANMNKISVTGFGLYGANVSGANMSNASFVTDPTNAHGYCEALWGATGVGVNLQGATISGCATGAFGNFANANLNGTTIGGDPSADPSGYVGGFQFWGASLPGATLRQANISGYDAFAGADLSGGRRPIRSASARTEKLPLDTTESPAASPDRISTQSLEERPMRTSRSTNFPGPLGSVR